MIVNEIKCKSILTATSLASIDYTINPYFGCQHGCVYCFCHQLAKRFSTHKECWGDYVDVKTNAPEILEAELKKKKPTGTVWLSSASDPYQPIEKEYEITRKLLEILVDSKLKVDVLSRGHFLTRDIDVYEKFGKGRILVGATINTLNDWFRRDLEPFAAPIEKRIEQLDVLRNEGIPIYASFGPIFPEITDIKRIFELFKDLGIKYAFTEKLNLQGENWRSLKQLFENKYPELLPAYEKIFFDKKYGDEWHAKTRKQIDELSQKYGIKCDVYFDFNKKFKPSSK